MLAFKSIDTERAAERSTQEGFSVDFLCHSSIFLRLSHHASGRLQMKSSSLRFLMLPTEMGSKGREAEPGFPAQKSPHGLQL